MAFKSSNTSWRRNLRFGTSSLNPSDVCKLQLKSGTMLDILPWLLLLSSSLFFTSVNSHLVNVTVDDQFGDPVTGLVPEYSPKNGSWNIGSPTENCPPACNIGPSMFDLTQIYDKTWLDGTYWPSDGPATITVHCTGSALYVYNILANSVPGTTTFSDISYSIDGEAVGRFTRSPDSSSTVLYNQLVYHNTTLNHGPHTLIMTHANVTLILFDYLIYTTQNDDTTQIGASNTTSQSSSASSSTTPTLTSNPDGSFRSSSESTRTPLPVGSIVGAALGGIALLGVTVMAFFLYRRRTRSKAAEGSLYGGKHSENGGGSDHDYGVRGARDQWHASLPFPPSTTPPTALPEPTSLDGPTAHSRLLAPDVTGPRGPDAYPDARLGLPLTAE